MSENTKPLYKRILLKLSGEALQGNEGFGIDTSVLDRIAQEVKSVADLGVQVAIVVGGGNLFRGAQLAKVNMNRVVGDHMGMLATTMNGLAIRDALFRAGVNCTLMSALPLTGVCETYSWNAAIRRLNQGRVLVFSGGTGNPFFTTDSAACLRGIEIDADIVLKATSVDGVYDSDPRVNPNAKRFTEITYDDVIAKELKVMDLAAFTLARDHKLPIRVFNVNHQGDLANVVKDPSLGTLIK